MFRIAVGFVGLLAAASPSFASERCYATAGRNEKNEPYQNLDTYLPTVCKVGDIVRIAAGGKDTAAQYCDFYAAILFEPNHLTCVYVGVRGTQFKGRTD